MSDPLSLARTCDEFRRGSSRRGFVQAGMLGATGLSLTGLLRDAAAAPKTPNGAASKSENNVLLLWMRGGPSHIDMWDPKPDAPVEFRGEFGTIDTNVPGIQLTDMLPNSAKVMDKWSIVRSLQPHRRGPLHRRPDLLHRLPAGRERPMRTCIPAAARSWPSNWAKLKPELPAYVMIPEHGARHRLGLPGRGAQAVRNAGRPGRTPARSRCRTSRSPTGLSVERLGDRRNLLDGLRPACGARSTPRGQMEALDRFGQQAWDMLSFARGPAGVRSRCRTAGAARAIRLHAGVRSRRRRIAAALRTGASGCCWPGGWSRRACGW